MSKDSSWQIFVRPLEGSEYATHEKMKEVNRDLWMVADASLWSRSMLPDGTWEFRALDNNALGNAIDLFKKPNYGLKVVNYNPLVV